MAMKSNSKVYVDCDDDGLLSVVSDALHNLTVTSHVGIADCPRLTSFLYQCARDAKAVRKAVEDWHTVDALFLANVATDLHTNDAWSDNVQTAVQGAASACGFGQLSRNIVVHAVADPADRTVAKTATKVVLPLCHRDCKHNTHSFTFSQGRTVRRE